MRFKVDKQLFTNYRFLYTKNMDCEDLPPLDQNRDDIAHSISENDSDFTDNDSDEEPLEQYEAATCLFCTEVLPSVKLAIDHVKDAHGVDLALLKTQFQMDQYSFIKLINCIRLESITEDKLQNVTNAFWNDEKYLIPLGYEPWLSYDYGEIKAETSTGMSFNKNDLEAIVKKLREHVMLQQEQLNQASQDMETMRKCFHNLVECKNEGKLIPCVSSVSAEADEGYFYSYAHFDIHHEMLSDAVRTISYRDAIMKNKNCFEGKYVLDVGCGTSVLSIFASQAGAAKVVGIDNSDIIYNAMDIVKKNNVENITLVKGRLEDTELPVGKFDVIISEWMGYFLLFEGMLDSIIYARNNHLKEDGLLLPNRCTMSILGYGNKALFDNRVTFWNNVYGLDMSNMRKEVMHEPLIDIVDAEYILTNANCVADLNLMKCDLSYSNFKYNFELTCCKDGELCSFVGYFDTYFELPEPVMFSTSPKDKPTHWKQVVFFIEEPQLLKKNDVIRGVLQCKRSQKSARSLDITIEAFNKKYTYYLD